MIDALPYLFFPLFLLMWICVSLLFAHLGGWARLAKHYPDVPEAVGTTYRFRSGMIGMVNYGNSLNLRVCAAGLRLSVLFPFRLGHPPLFIPWDQFQRLQEKNYFIIKFLETSVGNPEIATLTLPHWVREHIEAHANPRRTGP